MPLGQGYIHNQFTLRSCVTSPDLFGSNRTNVIIGNICIGHLLLGNINLVVLRVINS